MELMLELTMSRKRVKMPMAVFGWSRNGLVDESGDYEKSETSDATSGTAMHRPRMGNDVLSATPAGVLSCSSSSLVRRAKLRARARTRCVRGRAKSGFSARMCGKVAFMFFMVQQG